MHTHILTLYRLHSSYKVVLELGESGSLTDPTAIHKLQESQSSTVGRRTGSHLLRDVTCNLYNGDKCKCCKCRKGSTNNLFTLWLLSLSLSFSSPLSLSEASNVEDGCRSFFDLFFFTSAQLRGQSIADGFYLFIEYSLNEVIIPRLRYSRFRKIESSSHSKSEKANVMCHGNIQHVFVPLLNSVQTKRLSGGSSCLSVHCVINLYKGK